MTYKHLILAGTFDHFHLGHEKFIKSSAYKADFLTCAITTGWTNNKKLWARTIEPFEKRLSQIKSFLKDTGLKTKVRVIPLINPFGPTLSNDCIDVLAATKESLSGAKLVNQKRQTKNLAPLPIFLVDLVKAQDKKRISSTRIRLGQISRQGLVFSKLLLQNKSFYLPKNQRVYFQKPIGKLLRGPASHLAWAGKKVTQELKKSFSPFVITVGDITSQTFLLNKLPFNLAVVDYRCQRKPIKVNLHHQLKKVADYYSLAKNAPGTISSDSLKILTSILPSLIQNNQKAIVQIRGEEDLLVLPLILLAPLETLIFYGQPHQGLVKIRVTEKSKQKALGLFKKLA